MSPVIVAHEDALAILTLNEPERRNPLSEPVKDALERAFEDAFADPQIRVVLIAGAGGNFSSGGDLRGMGGLTLSTARARMERLHRLTRLIARGPKPVVAAVEGWCVGAAMGLALCCDTIVASRRARFVAAFARVGLIPDFGLLHTLPRRLGAGRAHQMLIAAETVAADEARAIGLVDELAPEGGALAAARARAARLAGLAPLSLARTREALFRGLDETLDWEAATQASLYLSRDHEEGKRAFFDKSAPVFTGA